MPSAAFGSGTPRHRSGSTPIQETPPPITRSSPVALRAPGLNRTLRHGRLPNARSTCSVHCFNTCPCPCGPPPMDENGRSSPYASQGCRGSRAMFRRRCPVLPHWHRTITSHGVPGQWAPMEQRRRHGQTGTMMADSPAAAQQESMLRDDAEALAPGESSVSTGRTWVRPVAFAVLSVSLALLGAVLFVYVRDHRSLEVAPGSPQVGLGLLAGTLALMALAVVVVRPEHGTVRSLIWTSVSLVARRCCWGSSWPGQQSRPSSARTPGTGRPCRPRLIWTPISRSTFRRGSTRSSSPPGSWSSRWNS